MALAEPEAELGELPNPWETWEAPPKLPLPPPFGVAPPKGRRHVLCQMERKEVGEDAEKAVYNFVFFGGIFVFRERFDEAGVPGALAPAVKEGDKQEYVRILEVEDSAEGREKVTRVLEEVLRSLPIYCVDAVADPTDAMTEWISQRKSVFVGEREEEK